MKKQITSFIGLLLTHCVFVGHSGAAEHSEAGRAPKVLEHVFEAGDTLGKIFHENNIPRPELLRLLEGDQQELALGKYYPGDKLTLHLDEQLKVTKAVFAPDNITTYIYIRDSESFTMEKRVKSTSVGVKDRTEIIKFDKNLTTSLTLAGIEMRQTFAALKTLSTWVNLGKISVNSDTHIEVDYAGNTPVEIRLPELQTLQTTINPPETMPTIVLRWQGDAEQGQLVYQHSDNIIAYQQQIFGAEVLIDKCQHFFSPKFSHYLRTQLNKQGKETDQPNNSQVNELKAELASMSVNERVQFCIDVKSRAVGYFSKEGLTLPAFGKKEHGSDISYWPEYLRLGYAECGYNNTDVKTANRIHQLESEVKYSTDKREHAQAMAELIVNHARNHTPEQFNAFCAHYNEWARR
ncbi:hypothetical protein [Motilimonas sp. KMU-193]|uniref:hypothetical protein n=1 Tax=Motilimonas sp. KMU-193 TaxID=3388668 RepID=UPI00396B3AB3